MWFCLYIFLLFGVKVLGERPFGNSSIIMKIINRNIKISLEKKLVNKKR